ncbi:P2Y purinoceptor 1-like [Melanotaenia boesemani]|uniref:P2Y purinoceptor 1-like n=1 Tax=Melanotaenia boesemani TaxID=1250792 RepID=UPI001C04CD3C|nr:P2Y purinoceptor 1-like [Melanotaenia boesemani]
MNTTSCQSIYFSFQTRFLPPVYVLVFIIGLVANGWGLKSLKHNWKKLGNISIFVLNLGLADVLYLLTLPFLIIYYYFTGTKWIFGVAFCKFTRFCFNVNLYCSIGFLTCISVYRYLAIVHPMRVMGRLTVTHSVAISVLVWLLVSVQSLPDMVFPKTLSNQTEKCFDTTSEEYVEDYLKYSLGWTFVGFCLPSLIILGCYGHVIVFLCYKKNIDEVLKQRSLKYLMVLILLFSVCYIPYHVLKNLNLLSRVLTKHKICHEWSNGVYIAHQICRGVVCLNSALNPLVYLHVNENIFTQLRHFLQRICFSVMELSSSSQQAVVLEMHTKESGLQQ